MLLLALLWSCTPVTPQQVAQAVISGDLEGGAELSAQLSESDGAVLGLRTQAVRWPQVKAQRRALERASRELLRDSIDQRLTAGDLSGAAAHLAAALGAWPDDTAFLTHAHALGEAAEQAPPDQAVTAWRALAELLAHQPERAEQWRVRAAQAQLSLAYGENLVSTRDSQAGIRREAAGALLDQVEREYVTQPDWAQLGKAATLRLSWLSDTEGAAAQWPQLADLEWPRPTGDRVADLDAAIAVGVAAGLPAEVVIEEWVTGALDALDPWTRAVWPAEISAWEAGHAGVVVGVGVELDQVGEQIVVVQPLPDTPAWQGGVHQDDIILWIEGEQRVVLADVEAARRLDVAASLLQGPPGSTVSVGLLRGERRLVLPLARAPVVTETVQGLSRGQDNRWTPWLDQDAGIAYVRISRFKPTTEADFDKLVEGIDARVWIVDLRGNPGGDVNSAVQVADRFVADGWLAKISGRVLPDTGPDVDPETGKALAEWNQALPGHALEGRPVVVLTDGATASAAEVLAGALQERAGAHVVGGATWGKGQAQALRGELELGYALQLTNLVWTLPSGHQLTRAAGGVVPQVDLGRSSPGEDFRVGWMIAERTAPRVHGDGSPMRPIGTPARQDLPALDADPVLLAGELVARSFLVLDFQHHANIPAP